MSGSYPIVTGKQLVKLLTKDGWEYLRNTRHAVALQKQISGRKKVVIIPGGRAIIPDGTLGAILGPKQMGIGKKGLLDLINKYGI